MHYAKLIIICILVPFLPLCSTYQAVVIAPVVDLFGEPLGTVDARTIPVCGGQLNPFIACKRTHQLLFHELVDVLEEADQWLRIAIPTVYYLVNNTPCNIYWAEKKYFLPLETIRKHNTLPTPYTMKAPDQATIFTLTEPHYDKKRNFSFSVGTRFIAAKPHQKRKKITVWALNPQKKTVETMVLPAHKCYYATQKTVDDRINDFVAIVRRLANLSTGYIPYVWGGCSFIYPAHSNRIEEEYSTNGNPCSFYRIHDYNPPVKTGFDCASLIARAAQICNIPYFFKNTTTLAARMDEIKKGDTLRNGDILWIPWHVMIVSDIDNNVLVEARGYNHGYGKVQEKPLNKVFKNINTYQELMDHIHAKKPLIRLNKNGDEMETYKTAKLLSMRSVFKQSNTLS